MELFDPFATPIEGSLFLEASAGTGKTFSIEQITRRLVEEKKIELKAIALVTFTKKAALELSHRVRRALRKSEGVPAVFTIHSFCLYWLDKLATHGACIRSPFEERERLIEKLLSKKLLTPSQMRVLLRRFSTSEALLDALLRLPPPSTQEDVYAKLQEKLKKLKLPSGDLFEMFCTLAKSYTKTTRRDGELRDDLVQKAKLCSEDPLNLECLLDGGGVFFETFDPSRLKKGAKPPDLGIFAEFLSQASLWREVSDPYAILLCLADRLRSIDDPDREVSMSYDDLLGVLDAKLEEPHVLNQMVESLKVIIIDEFQDTDPVQWSIFSKLMQSGLDLIVVGDPKQSIYGFRRADIYTYFSARDRFDRRYSLGTSYRSTYALTSYLNKLFSKRDGDFLWLPRLKKTEPFPLVKSASQAMDEPKAVTLFIGEVGTPSIDEQRKKLMPAVIEELLTLDDPSRSALIVRDRRQVALCIECLEQAGLSARADYEIEVKESVAYRAFRAFVDGEIERGLFGLVDTDFQAPFSFFNFSEVHQIALREGLPSALEAFLQTRWQGELLACRQEPSMTAELRALAALYAKEIGPHFSWEVFEQALCPISYGSGVVVTTIHKSKGLEYERVFALGLIQRTPALDQVIPTARGPRPKALATWEELEAFREELDAEKLRQFYVALTRARSHLYIPVLFAKKPPLPQTASAMELFIGYCHSKELSSEAMYSRLTQVTREESLSLFEGARIIELYERPSQVVLEERVEKSPLIYSPQNEPTASFSSLIEKELKPIELAMPKEEEVPIGTQTGLFVHEVIRRAVVTGAYQNFCEKDLERFSRGLCPPAFFARWSKELLALIKPAFELSIGGHKLSQIPQKDLMAEVPFLYDRGDLWMKGFIDLMAYVDGRLLILDWKTNWLKDYSPKSLDEAIVTNRYDLQADLYRSATKKMRLPWSVKTIETHYVFLRGQVTINVKDGTLAGQREEILW